MRQVLFTAIPVPKRIQISLRSRFGLSIDGDKEKFSLDINYTIHILCASSGNIFNILMLHMDVQKIQVPTIDSDSLSPAFFGSNCINRLEHSEEGIDPKKVSADQSMIQKDSRVIDQNYLNGTQLTLIQNSFFMAISHRCSIISSVISLSPVQHS